MCVRISYYNLVMRFLWVDIHLFFKVYSFRRQHGDMRKIATVNYDCATIAILAGKVCYY